MITITSTYADLLTDEAINQNIDDIREHLKQQGISENMIPYAIDWARKNNNPIIP
jgi:hypothetical protein